jgi:alkylated DNA nucleotide flippase Atl1
MVTQLVADVNRAMLPTGAANGYGQVAAIVGAK